MSDLSSFAVVTPAIAVNDFLLEAMASVRGQLYKGDVEHWIVFDRLESEIGRLPKQIRDWESERNPKLRVIFNCGVRGPSAARNLALENIKKDIVCFLDADDLWDESYLSTVNRIFNENSDVTAVTVPGVEFGSSGLSGRYSVPITRAGRLNWKDILWNPIGCPSGFSLRWNERNSRFRFNTNVRYCEDYLYYVNIAVAYKESFYRPSKINFFYRRSSVQATSAPDKHLIAISKRAFLGSLKDAPFDSLTHWQRLHLTLHAHFRFDRLLSKHFSFKELATILIICITTPKWGIAHFRRFLTTTNNL